MDPLIFLILGVGSTVASYAVFELIVSQYEKFKEDKNFALTVIEEIGSFWIL
jgi:succinate-acetate transporter protein